MDFNFDTPPEFPSDFHDSSSSSDHNENMEMVNNLEQEEHVIRLAIANNNSIIQYLTLQNNNVIHGGSVQGRSFIYRDRENAHHRRFNDYISETPVYNDALFRKRYRMIASKETSFILKKIKMVNSHRFSENLINIMDLPDHLIGDICVRVSKATVKDTLNLRRISKVFKVQSCTKEVLSGCSLDGSPPFPLFEDNENKVNHILFMKKLKEMGNDEAIFRKGVLHFFDQQRREEKRNKGLSELSQAAQKGNLKAIYILGVILLCQGENRRQEALSYLERLMQNRLVETIMEIQKLRIWLRSYVIINSRVLAKELLNGYYHGACECGGEGFILWTLVYYQLAYSVAEGNDRMTTCTTMRRVV